MTRKQVQARRAVKKRIRKDLGALVRRIRSQRWAFGRLRKGMRRLIIDDKPWHWFVGRGSVEIVAPDRRKFVVTWSELTGRSWNSLERGQWKRTSDGMIKPSDIRAYIEAHLLA